MKLLYTLIILFAFSFADVVTFEHKIFFIPYETTKEDVIFMGITEDLNNPKGAFNYNIDRYGEIIPRTIFIDCDKIISIKDDFMNDISFDCASPSILKEEREAKKGYIGGIFIAAGALILFVQSNKDYVYNATDLDVLEAQVKKDMDRQQSMNNIGYGMIAIGGFLVAVGI